MLHRAIDEIVDLIKYFIFVCFMLGTLLVGGLIAIGVYESVTVALR